MASESGIPSVDEVIARIHGEIERRRAQNAAAAGPAASGPAIASAGAALPADAPAPAFRLQPPFTPRSDGGYELHELLDFHDAEFVTNAYRALLGRWPDPVGMRHYVGLLRSGAASKVDVLGRIRWSREGRRRRVRVRGLLPRFAAAQAFRIPVLGALLHWSALLFSLPRLARNQQRFESYAVFLDESLAAGLRELGERIGELRHAIASQSGRLDTAAAELQQMAVRIADGGRAREERGRLLEAGLERVEAALREQGGEVRELRALAERLADQVRGEAAAREAMGDGLLERSERLERELRAIAEQAGRLEDAMRGEVAAREDLGGSLLERSERLERELRAIAEQAGRLDDAMRGEIAAREALGGGALARLERSEQVLTHLRHEVVQQARRLDLLLEEARRRLPEPFAEQQLRVFADQAKHRLDALYVALEDELRGPRGLIKERLVPYLAYLDEAEAGSERWPVLDLGCGRGEWLELLRERGRVARGVDLNPLLVADCTAAGLEVVEADLLEHLRKLPSGSLGAVTAFHVVEHLPLEVLVDALAEMARVLRPGGVVIFETPNPANVIVGSHTFYLDPTHRNPLPSLLLRFLVEARGFSRVEVLEVNPAAEVPPLAGDDPLTQRFNEFFCGGRDYAVIGRRP